MSLIISSNNIRKKIFAVIFDMDGVILDSEPLYHEIQQRFFAELGFTVSATEYDGFIGLGMRSMWKYLKKKHRLQISLDELIAENNKKIYQTFSQIENLTTNPNLIPFFEKLEKHGIMLTLASSTQKAIVDIILKKLQITSHFHFVLGGNEVQNGKPAPDIFLLSAKKMKLPAENCLVIEDSKNGVLAAKRAGMFCVGYQNSQDQDLSQADLVVNDFSKINFLEEK